jgi:ribosome-associated toxin RatA of RatAB toxin-antitoxin module
MITRSFEVEAPIEVCFEAAFDVESYPQFLRATKAVQKFGSGDSFEAEFDIDVIKPIRYRLRFRSDAPREISWSFVRGEVIKDNQGFWKFKKIDDRRTQVEYGVDVKFGLFVPKAVETKLTEKQLPGLIHSFSKRMLALAVERKMNPADLLEEEDTRSASMESPETPENFEAHEFSRESTPPEFERRGPQWESLLFATFEKIASAPGKLKDPKESVNSAVDWVRGMQRDVQERVKDEVGQRIAKIDWNLMGTKVADHLAKNYRLRIQAEVDFAPKAGKTPDSDSKDKKFAREDQDKDVSSR